MKTSHEYANALRLLAEEILACPEFPIGWTPEAVTMGVVASREEILGFAKSLHPLNKEYTDTSIQLTFGSGPIKARISAQRTTVCKLVEPAKPAVYECEPLLSIEDEAVLNGGL